MCIDRHMHVHVHVTSAATHMRRTDVLQQLSLIVQHEITAATQLKNANTTEHSHNGKGKGKHVAMSARSVQRVYVNMSLYGGGTHHACEQVHLTDSRKAGARIRTASH